MLFRILKNSIFVLFSQVILLLSSLFIYILVGRQFGPEGLGKYSFVLAYLGLFTFLPDMGLNLFLIREISRGKDKVSYYLGHAFTLVFLLSPITFVFVVAGSYLFDFESEIRQSIYFGALWIVMGAFLSLFRAAFHAHEKMEYETLMVLVERIVALGISVVILFFKGGIQELIGALFFARLLALTAAGFLFVVKIEKFPTLVFDSKISMQLLKQSSPFAVNMLTTTIYIQLDLVLLGILAGDEASGYYRAATSLIIPLAVVATSLNSALFPNMARASSLEQSRRMLEASMRYLLLIGWPIALGISILAPSIIVFIYGEEFLPSVLALQILAFVIPMRFVNNSMGNGLTSVNRQSLRSVIILVSACVNLLFNFILIPRYSYIGASYVTLITEIIILFLLFWGGKIYLGRLKLGLPLGKVLLAGGVMAGVAFFLQDKHLLISISISAVVYFFILFILKVTPSDDVMRLKQLVRQYRLKFSVGTKI